MAKKIDYSRYSSDELIAQITQLKERREYGLIWDEEREPEKIVMQCREKFPVISEVKNNAIVNASDKPTNILIEGDNFHALSVLYFTHNGMIDIIYIDPPYNTGNNDFTYNDKFVDQEDGYRHSKWLSFMKNRLRLARDLLREDGVIFISIGDDEQARLQLLCDDLFGPSNYIATLPRVAKKTSDKGTYFKPTKDYILVYAKRKESLGAFGIPKSDDISKYKDEDERGIYKKSGASLYQPSLDPMRGCKNQRYWIECPDGSFVIPPGNTFPKKVADAENKPPESSDDGVWRWTWETYLKRKDELIFTKATDRSPLVNENGKRSAYNIYTKVYWDSLEGETNLPQDIIYDYKNSQGTKALLSMGLKFSFSKPPELIKYLIRISQKSNDAIILDFFAGSGTTGQAVLELNEDDGGSRQFILCSNNENNIVTDVCYPRVQKIIEGYEFYGKNSTVIFEEKLSLGSIKKGKEVHDRYRETRAKFEKEYDELKGELKDNTVRLIGINQIKGEKQGLGGNLRHFRIAFVPAATTDQNKVKLTRYSIEMLCLKEKTFETVSDSDNVKLFRNDYHHTGIILNESEIPNFKQMVKNVNTPVSVYVFSLGEDDFAEEFSDIEKDITVNPIPSPIINAYKRIFR